MRIIIIEDEVPAAEDLSLMLQEINAAVEVIKILPSVKDAVEYFECNEMPDLIFCDIHLGDGRSFEIFEQVDLKVPVIFCTAFNDCASEAFSNNGINYILKPFSRDSIQEALNKFISMQGRLNNSLVETTGTVHMANVKKASSLLVSWKDRIIPVKIMNIAAFNIEYKMTQLVTFDNQKHFINHTLDELEEICGLEFYRVNRQYLLNRSAVTEVVHSFKRKLLIKLKTETKEEIIIGKQKIPEFLSWLQN